MHYTVLYRGPLSSCNYGCEYCPFAKRTETHTQLAGDRVALERFLGWCDQVGKAGDTLSVQFTPWGEALIRSWYQHALVHLSRSGHVRQVSIQTNLSSHLKWADACDRSKLGLWCTYHPTETSIDRFLTQCHELDARGVRYSVGIVGLKEHMEDARRLRAGLHPDIYLWVNAYKREAAYYADSDIEWFTTIDPWFPTNNTRHASLGKPCRAGEDVFTIDGDGTMRRCHFIKAEIGNIYRPDWRGSLAPTACTNDACGCHIGYVHMPHLRQYQLYKEGLIARIPTRRPWSSSSSSSSPPPAFVQVTVGRETPVRP